MDSSRMRSPAAAPQAMSIAAATSSSSTSASTSKASSSFNHILRTIRGGGRSASSASSTVPGNGILPSSPLAPITTALPASRNPFEPGTSASLEPVSPYDLATIEPPQGGAYDALFQDLRRPLPATAKERDEAVRQRIPKVRALAAAVERQSGPKPIFADDVPLAEVFRLCTLLLTAEQPQKLRIETCNLLTLSVKLADKRAANASPALTELRNGAPGSLSSKIPDSDQPLASIDRALFYRLVLSVSASDIDDEGVVDNTHVILAGLAAQLGALEVLAKDGRDVVGFPGLIVTLTRWLDVAWIEVQRIRAQLHPFVDETGRVGREAAKNDTDEMAIQQTRAISLLSTVERDVQVCLRLLTGILKYSFARIPLSHAEMVIRSAAELIIGESSANALTLPSSAIGSPPLKSTSLLGPQRSSVAPTPASRRSRSRDARPLVDGYSYYGLETISSTPGSNETSPSATPRSSYKPVSIDAVTSQLHASATASSAKSTGAAPMTLTTLVPSRHTAATTSTLRTEPELSASNYWVGPELHLDEVRSCLKLLDATLRYGHLPSACIDVVVKMLCRLLGYSRIDPRSPGFIRSKDVHGADWHQEVLPILSNILRSHCANAAIRSARIILTGPSASTKVPQPEDPAILVGAVSFFRLALAHVAEQEQQKQQGTASTTSNKTQKEDALAPSLTLALIMPALRAALKRQCDALDLEVLDLISDLLPSAPLATESQLTPSKRATVDRQVASDRPNPRIGKNVPEELFARSDWEALLDLTIEAKRHLEDLKLTNASFDPTSTRSGTASGSTAAISSSAVTQTSPVLAMLKLLERLNIAHPPRAPSESMESGQRRTVDADEAVPAHAPPWTPKLASFLLTLSPILPDATVSKLVRYYWTQHLCLPSNPDWLSNIRALLQAFFYRTPSQTSTSEQGARYDLVSLVFDHVYNAVQDLTAERDLFMTDIVLPLANSTLSSETDTRTESLLRSVLVHAAVLSGSQIPGPIDPDTEAVQSSNANQADTDLEEVFVEVRKLLCRLARSAPAHKTVAFDTLADETEGDHTESQPARGNHPSETKARNSALDLIAIFNRMAFSTPWIANSVDRDIDLSIRQRWERKTRAGCIAIFRDLLDLLKVRPASGSGTSSSASVGSTCTSTRLAILEWMLRLRTDRQHRVYITGDLDDLVCASAAILMKGPAPADDGLDMGRQTSSASNVDGRSRAASKATPVALRSEREGRDAQRSVDPTTRSVSRLRDLSRERGRSERSTDSNKRHPGERDRSTSQNRAQRPAPCEHLWRLPQTVSFEMPAVSLRSDIIYTYIHERNDMECCAGNTHLHSDKDNKPAPVPVSEFLAIAIDILRSEQDWEVVSYLLCHLPHQLSNKHLFCGPKAQLQVLHLRKDICQGILDDALLPKVVLPDDLKKTDVTAVVYETLVTLISYRTLFSRAEQDEMVDAFIRGLKKSHTTARSCIKALSIACYEMQKSFTRFFSHMLLTLTAVRSHMTMSVHILELIATVAQHPACYANFTETDYKRVFSIVLQYIEYHQSPEAATRDDYRASPATFSLSQYVMLMAFYNISLWFVILKIGDRPKYLPYISRGLLKANEGMEALSDQTQVCFDFLARFTHSNADSKPRRSFINQLIMGAPSAGSGRGTEVARHSKTWLMGNGLLTVSTAKKAGWVEIVIRRPSGTATMLCKLENVPMGILPDENGEKDQLPAMLMMNRDPEVMDSPTLDAPTDELTGLTAMTEGQHTQTVTGKQIGTSIRRRVEERLEVSDRLRARRPLGPAHFGLTARPRSSSVSVESTRPSHVHSGALSDELADSSLAMRQVMRDLLGTADKSSATIDAQGTSNAPSTAAKAKINTKEPEVDPSFFALQLSTYPDMLHDTAPILLPDEPATARLIKAIDFTPVVDFHKIGVLYVGPGQEEEVDILSNRHGSRAYTRFLQGLGHLVTLKGQEDVYTGGLDRNNDEHGKHAYVWTDEICQIVYHTATLMPNDERDPIRRSKKALIGNDFVHIVFNESGRDYKFGTIAGQFNYVNVCISPMTRGGVNLGSANPDDAVFYQVTLQRRPGMPEFSPVGDGQLLSAEALATFVRILALHSNVASQIYLDTGEAMQPYSSNWVSRLGHIRRARQQHLAKKAKAEGVDPASIQGMSANSAMADLYDFTKTF
ncbi:putative GTPase Activating protein [Pseudozyma hubeiensis]|nr:putative GTPase Activating protein [Pseudozyma hubeiensis]